MDGDELCFEHEELHRVLLDSIHPGVRDQFHMAVARRLLQHMNEEDIERHLFTVLSLLFRGRGMLTKPGDQVDVATLCLHTGRKAVKASAFNYARECLAFGISLLRQDSWIRQYDLSLSLYNAAAEVEASIGSLDDMELLVNPVFKHARSFDDRFQAYCTRIYAEGNGAARASIDHALDLLEELGEPLPRKPTKSKLLFMFVRLRRQLKGMTDEQLMSLPNLTNERQMMAMRVLHLISLTAFMSSAELAPFIMLKLMQLSLRGQAILSSFAFVGMASFYIVAFRDVKNGERFGKLALQYLERYKKQEYMPRVVAPYYSLIRAWSDDLKSTLEPLRQTHRVALMNGDIEYYELSRVAYFVASMDCGIDMERSSTKPRFRSVRRAIRRRLRPWAKVSPQNCLSMSTLVEAELAAATGSHESAVAKYDLAAEAARSSDFLMLSAIARELQGRYHGRCGDLKAAAILLGKARDCYKEWGALAKVRLLDDELRVPNCCAI